jgi:hypothetical protein
VLGTAPRKGDIKNEGLSCDVIENKYRKDVDARVTHDIYENKRLISPYSRYV